MIHIISRKHPRTFYGYLISILLLSACLYLLFFGTDRLANKTENAQLDVLTQAIQRASVQCYAIEGRYPPSVEYLEEHYGLSIDHEHYHVFYNGWASNIMPEITIIPADEP